MATSTHSGVTGAVDFDLSKLKLADLKRVATKVSVATKGTKSDLIVRLERCGNTAVNQALESLSLVSDSAALSHSVPPLPLIIPPLLLFALHVTNPLLIS